MKVLGIIRKIDSLGRVVIPSEVRELLNIKEGEMMSLHVEGDKVIVSKVIPACGICGERQELYSYKLNHICSQCRVELKNEKNSGT